MQRWKISIEYKGTHYAGWQVQPNQLTVQGQIMKALEAMCGQRIILYGAGRTDSGVHALEQVAHFDIPDTARIGKQLTEWKMREALNHFLRNVINDPYNDIAILDAQKVPDTFHARFSATKRSYIYRMSGRRSQLTFDKENVWHIPGTMLEAEKMHEAGQLLVGTHDFTTFRAIDATDQNPLRTVEYITVEQVGDEVQLRIASRSFLHNQVRYIVGALHRVGYGHWQKSDIQAILDAKDRRAGGPLAPATGLYLEKITYAPE